MTATLLPNAKTQFLDQNGKPLVAGQVFFYIPNTSTKKDTYQDPAQTILNTNPVVLDMYGQALIWGTGTYRQVVYDQFGNLIWDQITQDANASLVGNWTDNIYVAGTDFTPGTTTQLTLSSNPGSITNTIIFFDAAYQDDTQVSLNGNVLAFTSPIPVGVTKVTVKVGLSIAVGTPGSQTITDAQVAANAAIQSSKLSFLGSGAGYVARTVQSKLQDIVSVKDFNAKGDGTTNDTTAIAAADTYARSIGAQLYFPAGTYMASQLVLYTGSNWIGDGRNATIIKQIIGSNTDLVYGNNSNANWGTTNPTNIVVGFEMRSMTLNGNWNSGSGNTAGSGVAAYCARPIMEDVFITNCAEHGIRTEYLAVGGGPGLDTFAMEGWLSNVRIDTVGKHGWWNNGPNDTIAVGIIVVDAGQAAANTYDGFHFDKQSTGHNMGLHAWTRSASLRMSYALNLVAGAQHEFSGGCNFEGAWNGNVGIFTSGCVFDPSTKYYAAWNGVNIFMGKTATVNIIKGWLGPPGAGRPACIGLLIGSISGDFIGNNNIELLMNQQEAGNVTFTAFDGGNNIIRINAYNTTAAAYNGIPALTTDFELRVQNSGGTSVISNRHQKTSLNISGSSSATWTFPFAFNGNPILSGTPIGAAGGGYWITSLSSTAATIFNNTGTAITLSLNADAVN